jgi:hypothetical protein
MNSTEVKGFKVFNPDWTCRGFQYEVGKTYEMDASPVACDQGFHFCKVAKDCFGYYKFNPNNKVAEVVALGEIDEEGDKCATNKITIVREIPWGELLDIVNLGKGNSGLCNSGNRNSGNRNSGDCNSGNRNSGDWNSGNRNSGDWNSGDWNSGDWNSGDCNSGNRNSGNRNSGDWNSGDWNQGDYCTGDFNISDRETGCFCTEQHKIRIFDTESNMTYEEWRRSEACYLLSRIDFRPTEWIYSSDMTDEEKRQHSDHEITSGYLKVCDTTKAFGNWWESLNNRERQVIKNIPNFNADKFRQITGITVE